MPGTAVAVKLTGRQKAAILLISLGPELSAGVLKRLRESDVEKLTLEVFGQEKVTEDVKKQVYDECHQMALARNFITSGGAGYAREMLEHALGKAKADEVFARLSSARRPHPFSFLHDVDPAQLTSFVHSEHPQTVALVLAHLDPVLAARVLSRLESALQSDVATRLARMESTPPEIVEEVADMLKAKLALLPTRDAHSVGGVDCLVKVLTNIDRETEKVVLDTLDESNAELAAEVRKQMFAFEDLLKLDPKAMQRVLREVDSKDLPLALRGATQALRDHIFRNLSSRTAEMIRDEMNVSGPVRRSAVQDAQQRVVSVVRRLEESEEIVVQRGGEDALI